MAVLDELMISLGVRTDTASFARASDAIEGLVQGGVNIAAAVGTAVTALFGLAAASAQYADEAHDAAVAIGMEAGALLELRWAMERATGSSEGLEGALRVLARSTQDALDGGEASARAFARLGISVDDLAGKSPDQVLAMIADGMREIPTATERTALAMDLLGRSGGALVPMLVEGSDGIERMRERARMLGATLDEDTERAAGEFNDTLDDLLLVSTHIMRTIGYGMVPVFTRWGKAILGLWERNRDLIHQRLDSAVDAITGALRLLEGPLGIVVGLFAAIGTVRAAASLGAIAKGMWAVAGGTTAANAALVPFVKALGAIAIAVVALEDFYRFAQGDRSLVEVLLGKVGASERTIEMLRLITQNVVEFIGAVERFGRLNLGRAVGIFSPIAGADIARSEAFVPEQPIANRGQFDNWIPAMEAERRSAAESIARSRSTLLDFMSLTQGPSMNPVYNIAINSVIGNEAALRHAVREAILGANREASSQTGRP